VTKAKPKKLKPPKPRPSFYRVGTRAVICDRETSGWLVVCVDCALRSSEHMDWTQAYASARHERYRDCRECGPKEGTKK